MFARHSDERIPITPYEYELDEQNGFPDECCDSRPTSKEEHSTLG